MSRSGFRRCRIGEPSPPRRADGGVEDFPPFPRNFIVTVAKAWPRLSVRRTRTSSKRHTLVHTRTARILSVCTVADHSPAAANLVRPDAGVWRCSVSIT